ncbi:MAG: phage major tail tube protein [Chryseobacterium sp. SCN 40-13]|nr:MAG: phage major tail tube protein [Chryseobacterium sp. SCN 40-13]
MAQKIKIGRLTNANIYVDGSSLLGRVEEFNCPTLTYKQAEHKALGLNGTVEYYAGIDKMEGSMKWTSYYPEFLRKLANPFKAVRVQVRGNLEEYQGGERVGQTPAVVFLTIQPKDFPLGNFVQHDNVELTTNYGCTYVRMEINGEVITEVDVESNIFKVDGEDLLATYRRNLGI